MVLLNVLLLSACFLAQSAFGQSVNTLCLIAHCQSEMSACVLDSGCSQALSCIQKCGANQTCDFICLASYANAQFDAFLRCAVTVNHCIKLAPPTPFQCKKPTNVLTNFTISSLQGEWYVVKGMNHASDCFNCHISEYTTAPAAYKATLTDKYRVSTVGGGTKQIISQISVQQSSPSTGGILVYSSTQDGLNRQDEYRILDYSSSLGVFLAYFCGDIAGIIFEGVLVLSRNPSLSGPAVSFVTSSAASFGYNVSTFCSPQTSACPAF